MYRPWHLTLYRGGKNSWDTSPAFAREEFDGGEAGDYVAIDVVFGDVDLVKLQLFIVCHQRLRQRLEDWFQPLTGDARGRVEVHYYIVIIVRFNLCYAMLLYAMLCYAMRVTVNILILCRNDPPSAKN